MRERGDNVQSKYDTLVNPYHADFEQGREDASEFNPYFKPGERQGEPLTAYKAGFEFGEACMEAYYVEQEGE